MEGTDGGNPDSRRRLNETATDSKTGTGSAAASIPEPSPPIDIEFLRAAFRRTRKNAATGVDGQRGADYAAHLEENLQGLLARFKSGCYTAPPVRRAYVPKGDGTRLRPVGVPTFEDKVLQRAVGMVLEAVDEQDFLACSYGFRPGRSAHQALQALWQELMQIGGGWVVEVDIHHCFDTVDPCHWRRFLDQRVRDGVIRRTLDKGLKAGVLEGTTLSHPEQGTPQGSGVSTPKRRPNTSRRPSPRGYRRS